MSRSSSVVVLLAWVSAVSCNGLADNGSLASTVRSSDVVYPASWVSDLFYQALANFTVRNVGSAACRKHSKMYDEHLRNYTDWAVRITDSWNRYPIGILAGNKYQLGIYDQCVDVQYPVKGQYCLSEVKLIPSSGYNYSFDQQEDLDNLGNNHAWHTILGWLDYPDKVQRNVLNLGICIPDTCTALDLEKTLQEELNKVFLPEGVKAIVKVDPIMCTVSGDMYPYNTAYYVTSAFFVLLILICWGATLHHFVTLSWKQNKTEACDVTNSFFNSFSFIESSKELLKFDKDNELNLINGFKVLTMVSILYGHRFMYLAGNPMSYPKFVENIYLNGPDILRTSMNLVDPFFFMSGFLVYLTISPVFKKTGSVWIKLVSPIIYRIIRMLPSYCAMMAITAHIVPHLGDGPLWPQKTLDEAEKCKSYWWTNLLFINNFIDVKYQCLIVSWYVSCDIQFFIIGVIIVYVYMKDIKYGIGLLVTVLSVSLFVPFIMTYLTKNDGILKVYLPFLENPRSSITFNESYRPSYMRATPFFTGLAFSFIVNKLKTVQAKFSEITVYCGTFIVVVICLLTQFYGAKFYTRQRPYYPLEQALYSTVSHCIWAVSGGWIAICHFTTGYGLLTKLFNNRFVVPLGRLSYSVFLVNLTVMMISQSSQRLPSYPSTKTLLDVWIFDTFKSYLMGLTLHLVVEAPFGNLTKKLFGRGKKKNNMSNTNRISTKRSANTETLKKELFSF